MKTKDRTPGQPAKELQRLRRRIAELEKSEAEHKKMEEKLQDTQARYQALFDRTLYCVFVHDFEGRFLDANDAAFTLLGYTRKEFPSNFASLLDQDQLEVAIKRGKEIRLTGSTSEPFEYRVKKRNGGYVWVDVESSLIYREGKPYAIQGIARDITEQKLAEEALRESEAKYRDLVENINDIIYATDEHGIITYVAPRIEAVGGYTTSELIGRPFFDFVYEEDIPFMRNKFKQDLSGHAEPREYRAVTKAGDMRWVRVFSRPSFKERRVIGLRGVMTDITDRKRAEEQVRESQQRFQNLVETLSDWIWEVDQNGIYTYASPKVRDLLGYKPEEVLGKTPFDLMPPGEAARVKDIFESLLAVRQPVMALENINRHKDGHLVVFETSGMPFCDAEGRLKGYRGVDRDVTDRKHAEEALQRSYQQLRETFISTVNALASTVEMKDPYTAGHQRWATRLACAIAREMGLTEERIEGIRMAGLIHDIGKINIPAEILSKPGQLSDIQYNMVKIHAQVGCDILREIKFPWPVAKIVLQHHERWDGSGYPERLSGEEIILEARILAVADTVEAMASHRPYRVAHGIESALEEISQNRGTLYDPAVVDACLTLFEKGFRFD
ncbi:MAG: PAS domain S-box protein [Deltaproteobacteria bacterium]|nr:PAS domain S-box protein [Deltaproteobacteria bacterium]